MFGKTTPDRPVTYHVGERPPPANKRPASAPGLVVENPKPPRAAEARPLQAANSVRGIAGRASIFSVRGFVRVAACLVGAFQAASANAHVASTTTAFPVDDLYTPPGGVHDAVTMLSQAGVEIFFVAQGDGENDASLSAMNAVLHGVCADRDGVLLQQDAPVRSSADPMMLSDARRLGFDHAISNKAHQIGQDPHGRFSDLWNSGCMSPYSVSSNPAKPNQLGDVIDAAPNGTVVGLSKEFAFYLHAGSNTLRFPGQSGTVPVPQAYQLAGQQLAKQEELYGLFQAASKVRPTALIVTTESVAPAEIEELWGHFQDKFAVSMVPLEDGVQAMIIAPFTARSELTALIDRLTERDTGGKKV